MWDSDSNQSIAIGIGTFVITAVIIGLPILAVLSFVFSWPGIIKFVTITTSLVIFGFLWGVMIDFCSD